MRCNHAKYVILYLVSLLFKFYVNIKFSHENKELNVLLKDDLAKGYYMLKQV